MKEEVPRGSIREVKWLLKNGKGYDRVKSHLQGKYWYIVGFSEKAIVLRIENENVVFDRGKGTINERFKLK